MVDLDLDLDLDLYFLMGVSTSSVQSNPAQRSN